MIDDISTDDVSSRVFGWLFDFVKWTCLGAYAAAFFLTEQPLRTVALLCAVSVLMLKSPYLQKEDPNEEDEEA